MLRPFLLTRASIGLAATAVEQALALPGRATRAVDALPTVPVRLAGHLVQSYLHLGQTVTELAVRGDQVIGSVVGTTSDQPEWVTFDEDVSDPDERLDVSFRVYGSTSPRAPGGDGPDVPTGRVSPRTT